MKNWKKSLLVMLCLVTMFAATACGNNGMDQNDTNNDVTEGTDNNGGVIDDVGDAVGDGINDVGDGVKDMTDDVTGNKDENTNKQ